METQDEKKTLHEIVVVLALAIFFIGVCVKILFL
jgi:hypothetical protein